MVKLEVNKKFLREWTEENQWAFYNALSDIKEQMSQYVPYKSGLLRNYTQNTIDIAERKVILGIEYLAPYADIVNQRTNFLSIALNRVPIHSTIERYLQTSSYSKRFK